MPARQHTEYAWRKYEPYIQRYAQTYPEPIRFECAASVETFAARLRDAVRAQRTYGYTTNIPRHVLDDLSVSILAAPWVEIGPRKRGPVMAKPAIPSVELHLDNDQTAAATQFKAICWLYSTGCFKGEVVLTNVLHPQNVVHYNVLAVPTEQPNAYRLVKT